MNGDLVIEQVVEITSAREIRLELLTSRLSFSIGTLMTRPDEYKEMIQSFIHAGFDPDTCEFLYINNQAGNQVDAFAGLNLLLQAAQGKYVVLCHQDIRLDFDRREVLETRIAELNQIDPRWAVLGNAGMDDDGRFCANISHPPVHNPAGNLPAERLLAGSLPSRCQSLDENFLVLKRDSGLRFSVDLTGFHFYGTDICQMARTLGYSAWVVNFHLLHKSHGKKDEHFVLAAKNLEAKLKRLQQNKKLDTVFVQLRFDGGILSLFREYRQLYMFQRDGEISELARFFSGPKLLIPLFWVIHKTLRPMENLKHSVNKRLFRGRTKGCLF
jgi:hypothetical protein